MYKNYDRIVALWIRFSCLAIVERLVMLTSILEWLSANENDKRGSKWGEVKLMQSR